MYCLKDVSVQNFLLGVSELISVILVAALYVWKRNTLVSIISGTVCYMLLIRLC